MYIITIHNKSGAILNAIGPFTSSENAARWANKYESDKYTEIHEVKPKRKITYLAPGAVEYIRRSIERKRRKLKGAKGDG